MDERNVTISWSTEDGGYIAVCNERPGCSAFGETIMKAYKELSDARDAWDQARARASTPMTEIRIPDGARIVRRATDAEAVESGVIALIRLPDGKLYWLGIDGGFVEAGLQVVRDAQAE